MDYKIVEKDSFKVIGPELKVRNDNGDNFRLIPKFWDKFEKDGMYEVIKNMPNVINKGDAIMGMCADFDGVNTFDYLICVEAGSFDHIPEGMVGKTVPKQKYAVFTAKGKMPEAIQKRGNIFMASGSLYQAGNVRTALTLSTMIRDQKKMMRIVKLTFIYL